MPYTYIATEDIRTAVSLAVGIYVFVQCHRMACNVSYALKSIAFL